MQAWDYYIVANLVTSEFERTPCSTGFVSKHYKDLSGGLIRLLWSDGERIYEYDSDTCEWCPIGDFDPRGLHRSDGSDAVKDC